MAERKGFGCPLEYDLGAAAGQSGKTYTAQAQDICANGLKILTDNPLEKGMVVRLSIPMSSLEVPLPVFAEVAWAVAAKNRFRVGLRFLK